MRIKLTILLIFLFEACGVFGQVASITIDPSDINQLDKRGKKSGWWIVYLDSTMTPVEKEESVLKIYVFYTKGKGLNHPIYFIKDSLERAKIKKKYRGNKFTEIENRKGNWDTEFADGEYEFIRYKQGDSTKFWNIEFHYKEGILTYQRYESHPVKGKVHKIESDYTIKYQEYPISFYKKFPSYNGKKELVKTENYVYVKKGRIKTKVKVVDEYAY